MWLALHRTFVLLLMTAAAQQLRLALAGYDVLPTTINGGADAGLSLTDNTVYDCAQLGGTADGPLFTITMTSHDDITITGVTVQNCPMGAFKVIVGFDFTITWTDCTFTDNTIGLPYGGSNPNNDRNGGAAVSVTWPTSGSGGGGDQSFNFINCIFTGNHYTAGSVIYLHALLSTGQLLIQDSTFDGNYGEAFCDPPNTPCATAAVYLRGVNGMRVTITRSTFKNTLRQGAVHLSACVNMGSISVTDSTFDNNTRPIRNGVDAVANQGGALYFDSASLSSVIITASTFRRNFGAGYGGAISADLTTATQVVIGSSLFEDNTAVYRGGALHLPTIRVVSIQTTQFLRNTARTGGALYVSGAFSTTLMSVTFDSNSCRQLSPDPFDANAAEATPSGGAVTAAAGAIVQAYYGTTFTNNSAGYSGAVECDTCGKLVISGDNGQVVFKGNTAQQSAGAIGFYRPTDTSSIEDLIFQDNSAATNVGAITDQECKRGVRGLGGAVCVAPVSNTLQTVVEFRRVSMERNTATTGGAVYISGSTAADGIFAVGLSDSVGFNNNIAAGGAGGGVYVDTKRLARFACGPLFCSPLNSGLDYGGSNQAQGTDVYGPGIATGLDTLIGPSGGTMSCTRNQPMNLTIGMRDARFQEIRTGSPDSDTVLITAALEDVAPGSGVTLSGTTFTTTSGGRADFSGLKVMAASPAAVVIRFTATRTGKPSVSLAVTVLVLDPGPARSSSLPTDNTEYDCAQQGVTDRPLFTINFDEQAGSFHMTGVHIHNCPKGAVLVNAPWGFKLYIDDCGFYDNGVVDFGTVGTFAAIFLDNVGGSTDPTAGASVGLLQIRNSIFDANRHTNGTIKIVQAQNLDIKLDNVTFQNNEGEAALAVYGSTYTLAAIDCVFQGQINGGGVLLYGGKVMPTSPIMLTRCSFLGNTRPTDTAATSNAGRRGGGLYLTGTSVSISMSLTNCIWRGNKAAKGGALAIDSSGFGPGGLTASLNDFSTNEATEVGGALYLSNVESTLSHCTLTSNTAMQGGAVYVRGEYALTSRDTTFTTNTCPGNVSGGGAITASTLSGLWLQSGTVFTQNSAAFGGAVECDNCRFIRTASSG